MGFCAFAEGGGARPPPRLLDQSDELRQADAGGGYVGDEQQADEYREAVAEHMRHYVGERRVSDLNRDEESIADGRRYDAYAEVVDEHGAEVYGAMPKVLTIGRKSGVNRAEKKIAPLRSMCFVVTFC